MVQINLKLKLSKIKYIIEVSYNTFEKATYDQYLMASLALRSNKDKQTAYQYIDDITGSGSLNGHFKQLYDKASELTEGELKDIMNNSMYPMLKIDKSNSYIYYPQLNISVFNNKVYEGDFGKYKDVVEKLYIQEKVIDLNLVEKSNNENPEPYIIELDEDNNIFVNIFNEMVPLKTTMFKKLVVNDPVDLDMFKGKIHAKTNEGSDWYVLTNSVINDMYSNNHFFYDYKGNHCLIRKEDVRKTIICKAAGFYVYREEIVPYINNKELCEAVLNSITKNQSFLEYKERTILNLISCADDIIAQSVINYILVRKNSEELARFGINLLKSGLEKNWEKDALICFMKHADSSSYGLIYKVNPRIVNDIEILRIINPDYLTPVDKKKVEEYNRNKQAKIDTIKKLIGEVTASGLRERMKMLKASDDSRRFTKIANVYIGHSKYNYEDETPEELERHLKKITEMYDLMKRISALLSKKTK